jgi:GMP synthase (glutamine-hydrolysing)
MTKSLLALRHVAFEDLGGFEAPLKEAGYSIRYCDMGLDDPVDAAAADMLAVLGGPVGAYEDGIYPFLKEEIRLIADRLQEGKPVLGLCLGAQLMARALGARVYPGPAKEIGFKPVTLTREGEELLAPLRDQPVLHWHGDTFDLPPGAVLLAKTDICAHQAFAFGRHGLAFQFHPEARTHGFERWLIGHAGEIAATPGISVPGLRDQMRAHGAAAEKKGQAMLARWLAQLGRQQDEMQG